MFKKILKMFKRIKPRKEKKQSLYSKYGFPPIDFKMQDPSGYKRLIDKYNGDS
jgi:hypothetical protein